MTDLALLRTAVMRSPFDRALQLALADELIEREGLSKLKALRQSLCFARATKVSLWVAKWNRRLRRPNSLRASIAYYLRLGLVLEDVYSLRIATTANCASPLLVRIDFVPDEDGGGHSVHHVKVGVKWLEKREEAIMRFHNARMREQRKLRKAIENSVTESH